MGTKWRVANGIAKVTAAEKYSRASYGCLGVAKKYEMCILVG
jgi:hypothetical protein